MSEIESLPKPESNSPLIFIVDDDLKTLRLISHILSKVSCKIHCVSSAEAALKWLQNYAPDIILMDINLPGKDGFGILEDIKDYDNLDNSIIVAFTSFARPGDEERFIKAGFDYYFAKPFSKENLLAFTKQMTDQIIIDFQK
jgi:two-component system cell cycle response regulator DivK